MTTKPLFDIAMSYVRSSGQPNADDDSFSAISDLFSQLVNGENFTSKEREELASLLIAQTGNANALEKIETILNCDETPLMLTIPDFAFDNATSLRRKTRPWTAIEDTRLLAGIHRFGLENWQMVAKFVGNGRTRAQCAQRWTRGLDPRISKDQWTHEDELQLVSLIESNGNRNWTVIASQMGNRSDVQCRYHFLQLQRDATFREEHPTLCQDFPPIRQRLPRKLSPPPTPPIQRPPLGRRNSLSAQMPPLLPPLPNQMNFQPQKMALPPPLPVTRERHGSFSGREWRPPIFSGHEFDDFNDFDVDLSFGSETTTQLSQSIDWGTDAFAQDQGPPQQEQAHSDFGSPMIW